MAEATNVGVGAGPRGQAESGRAAQQGKQGHHHGRQTLPPVGRGG